METHALERGQTLPLIAMTVLVLVGVAGFAADVGYHQYQQRIQQTATDSAALAGAAELANGNYVTAGQRDATSNGFTQGQNGVTTVNVVAPPAAPDPYASDAHAVEADITATYPTWFEKVFGIGSVTVTTKAVAISDSPSNLCLVGLNTTGTSTINAHSVINAPTCSAAINSAHLSIGGQSTITMAVPIQYSGTLTGAGNSSFFPGAPVQALPVSDPCDQITSCAYLQQNPPSTATCPNGNFSGGGLVPSGTYCNVMLQSDAVLNGLYVITGSLTANKVNVTGTDVTIVQTSTNCPNVNNANLTLSAPTSGSYTGMLWYDPNCTNPVTMNSAGSGLGGVIYFPKATLNMNAGATADFIIIAGLLSLNAANTTFTAPSYVKITYPRLVE